MIDKLRALTFMVVLMLTAFAPAQTFTDLYSFTGGSDGGDPVAALVQDTSGNLYGTTVYGGPANYGVVFEVTTSGTETVLHSFTGGSTDGADSYAPLLLDSAGNLYGTTGYGGASDLGVVFKIDSAGKETILHSFAGAPTDGAAPFQGLVMDEKGNLYGTTETGGTSGEGTVFKLSPKGKETVLHSFAGGASDGAGPSYGSLLMDKAGNLYGVTEYGGPSDKGVLYKLTAKGKLTVLHSFAGGSSDGCWPFGTVAMDEAGNLYGTTSQCGSSGYDSYGTVWKVSKKGKETILYNWGGGTSGGCYPYAGVVLDSKGNLYGNTNVCGAYDDGIVWDSSQQGRLTHLLQSFDYSNGAGPLGELLRTANGELFGTAESGGSHGYGVVWSYVP